MNNSLGTYWVALSATGGLLLSVAIPGHLPFLGLSIVFSYMAYSGYKTPHNKRKFLAIAAVDVMAGLIIYFMPHSDAGGLAGAGMVVLLLAFIPSLILLWGMFKSEYVRDDNGGP